MVSICTKTNRNGDTSCIRFFAWFVIIRHSILDGKFYTDINYNKDNSVLSLISNKNQAEKICICPKQNKLKAQNVYIVIVIAGNKQTVLCVKKIHMHQLLLLLLSIYCFPLLLYC